MRSLTHTPLPCCDPSYGIHRYETESYDMTGNTGSLRYMAPEVVLNKPYTEKVDVFSFAVVMWTICKCKVPYKGYDRAMHKSRGA